METPVRLICPDCQLVYRVKRLTLGKAYNCKQCGHELQSLEPLSLVCPACDKTVDVENFAVSTMPHCDACPDAPALMLPGQPPAPVREPRRAVTSAGDLARLPGLIEALGVKLDALRQDALAIKLEHAESANEEKASMQSCIDDCRQALRELAEKMAEAGPATVEMDMEQVADRLAASIRSRTVLDAESGSAVDALARVADELVREQTANTARLDVLATEIKNAIANISQLDEWKGELPARVADEIGHTVEERVVGPISGALARQAPAILSELQDHKLVDIVSRSVREAQRPLLREILAGSRGGIPVWLFASVLLPLLLILGYLFLPGEFGGDTAEAQAAMAEDLARISRNGVALDPAAADRLASIEDVVLDIHAQAMAHVKNAASLEQEVKSLKGALGERDRLIQEYNDTLDKQMKRLAAYERRLIQLGVSPTAVPGE